MNKIKYLVLSALLLLTLILNGCKSRMPGLFSARSPHDQYRGMLINAGLDRTAMGAQWLSTAEKSLAAPIAVRVPFRESGYFPADRVVAASYRFSVSQGQKLTISIDSKAASPFRIYADLWEIRPGREPKLLAYADTLNNPFTFDADAVNMYLLRLQPELLQGGAYTVEIGTGPSLAFPVQGASRKNIGSYFGAGRDANTRKHEGVDIFAAFRTPAIASASGTVVRVNENNLGGRVVWLRPDGKEYTLYYAHLDEQLAKTGQRVQPGDTLGLVGNTGNARTTPPHLHFGIYASGGAVNPLPFIDPQVTPLPPLRAALQPLNTRMRTQSEVSAALTTTAGPDTLVRLPAGTIVLAEAASEDRYRVTLPDGSSGYISAGRLRSASAPLRKFTAETAGHEVFDLPLRTAAVRFRLEPGERADVLGTYKGYILISNKNQETGWVPAPARLSR
ncbi:peptidase M23 [Pedobacter yulinensis]|uniref:Peptidase M23 n=1 Tax=Pedobacter yulinensis TaxID=2126353 RepID=A0A2T3HJV7_9SPHI|nr:M23 family metallopeptidase [Pedobacter yulinensis]PST82727.1 peptidase M23 [Pedobacter yulinensis]